MREIVDKHFNDNWVITYYIGFFVDLSVQWAPYKAANSAILNILEEGYLKDTINYFSKKLYESIKKMEEF